MLLEYDRYKALGGTLDEKGFAEREREAELLLDHWTLNRLHDKQVVEDLTAQGLQGSVESAVKAVVDRVDGIRKARKAKADGTVLTSFSNGVDSFGFGGVGSSSMTDAERECMEEVMRLLPVDLTSGCVSFNGAM